MAQSNNIIFICARFSIVLGYVLSEFAADPLPHKWKDYVTWQNFAEFSRWHARLTELSKTIKYYGTRDNGLVEMGFSLSPLP